MAIIKKFEGYYHWRRSALNSAGAFPENFGEFSPIHILYYKISGRGSKSGGARAPAAPASSAPMNILLMRFSLLLKLPW